MGWSVDYNNGKKRRANSKINNILARNDPILWVMVQPIFLSHLLTTQVSLWRIIWIAFVRVINIITQSLIKKIGRHVS